MGGAIFVMDGGSLTALGGVTVIGNTVTAGSHTGSASDGSAFGGGLFLNGNGTIRFTPANGQTDNVFNAIDDEAGVVANGYTPPSGFTPGSYSLIKSGLGTLVLSAHNAYSGGTVLEAGVLDLAAVGAAGTGAITFSGTAELKIESAALSGNVFGWQILGFAAGDTIDLPSLPFVPGASASYDTSLHTLSLTSGPTTVTFTLLLEGVNQYAALSDGAGGTELAIPPPTITGTVGGQTTTTEAPVTPFKGVTIGDVNVGATDTLTITLGGGSGTLSGAGLSGGAGGVYTLFGTAATITAELDALVFTPIFTPKAGAPNASSTTTFTLRDVSSAGGQPAVDTTTTVIDKTATLIIETRPHALVDAKHHPPGQPSPTNGPDVIIALGANDTIKGLGGNDSLVGGAPGVVMFGGPGADHFIFEALKASPPRHPDTIMDFSHRQGDKIDLYDLRDFVPGSEPLAFIGSQTFAQFHHNHHGVFGMVRYAGGEVQVNFDHHLTNEFEIVMHGSPTLHASDFVL
jgi:autotransporter-associated beta strand protein